MSGVVGALEGWGRVTYHHEALLVLLTTMKGGFEALPGRPEIGKKAVATSTPEQGWMWAWGEGVIRDGVSHLGAVLIG